MTPIKRPLAALGTAALLAVSLSACGGAPTDASKDDFCKAVQNEDGGDDVAKAIQDEDWDKVADLIKEQVDSIEEVGTPEDISDKEREGFEIQLDAAKDIDADAVEDAFKKDMDPFEEGLSDKEKDKVEAYNDYESKTCSDTDSSEGDSGSDTGSDATPPASDDVPSIDPSDVPSIDPSQLPTDLSPEDLASLQSELENLTQDAQ